MTTPNKPTDSKSASQPGSREQSRPGNQTGSQMDNQMDNQMGNQAGGQPGNQQRAGQSGSQGSKPSGNQGSATSQQSRTISIEGMEGDVCVQNVKDALKGVKGVTVQSIELGTATISASDEACEEAIEAIDTAGYPAEAASSQRKA